MGIAERLCAVQGTLHMQNVAGPSLLQALSGSEAGERMSSAADVSWSQRAVNVYREFLSAGHKPRPHVVERMLACLRQPLPPKPKQPTVLASPFKVNTVYLQISSALPYHISDLATATKMPLFVWNNQPFDSARRGICSLLSAAQISCTALSNRRGLKLHAPYQSSSVVLRSKESMSFND